MKEADPGLSSAEVSWDAPIVYDNLDGTDALVVRIHPSSIQSPLRFEIGSVVITYTATDTAGGSSVCAFKVVITGKKKESCFWFSRKSLNASLRQIYNLRSLVS